eukprot:1155980-Pelagomonas_calceolata.AAC.3
MQLCQQRCRCLIPLWPPAGWPTARPAPPTIPSSCTIPAVTGGRLRSGGAGRPRGLILSLAAAWHGMVQDVVEKRGACHGQAVCASAATL